MSTIALEVLIDGSRAPQGAAQVEQALGRVKAAADTTATSVQNVGRATSAAFQATGGTIQVAQGITQTARAFGELNTAAGLFSSSRTLLEIGRTAQDFRQMRTAIGGASGAFGLLTAAFRASPIGLIATGIGLAATAMSLFSGSTDKATESVQRQTSAITEMLAKSRELGIRAGYGERDPRTTTSGTVDALTQLQLEQNQSRRFNIGTASRLFGTTEAEFRQALGEQGLTLREAFDPRYRGSGQFAFDEFSLQEVRYGGERLLDSRRRAEAIRSTGGTDAFLGPIGPGSRSPFTDRLGVFGGASPANYVEQSAEDQARVAQENYERQVRAAERVAQVFEGIGQSIGSVAADLLFAGGSLRQAFAGLVRQGATSALQQGFGAALGALGKTFAQGSGDQQLTPPGGA